MTTPDCGMLLGGDQDLLRRNHEKFLAQPVDLDLSREPFAPFGEYQRTIANPVEVRGPGTFFGKATRTIRFEPSEKEGWWFRRSDLSDCLPTEVSIRNVWTTGEVVSNIVLRSGSPHNYVRMVEHIVSLKAGLGIDNLCVTLDSGDPPIFNRGSMDLVEALEKACVTNTQKSARCVTVKEPVALVAPHGGFLLFAPCAGGPPRLDLDVAIAFPNAIGQQRIRLPVTYDHFRTGAEARTNTTAAKKFYCQTIGKLFADVRNLGYTEENVLVAGRKRYVNEPHLMHGEKSLEAAWHRACLDLMAAVALIDSGRFVGKITSFKAGHSLDVQMITRLYLRDLLTAYDG
ncbi:MAG: UDP-3-O-acyl-N-acetylglucosamine deacetylase [Kiritimatiellia bacterium]